MQPVGQRRSRPGRLTKASGLQLLLDLGEVLVELALHRSVPIVPQVSPRRQYSQGVQQTERGSANCYTDVPRPPACLESNPSMKGACQGVDVALAGIDGGGCGRVFGRWTPSRQRPLHAGRQHDRNYSFSSRRRAQEPCPSGLPIPATLQGQR